MSLTTLPHTTTRNVCNKFQLSIFTNDQATKLDYISKLKRGITVDKVVPLVTVLHPVIKNMSCKFQKTFKVT